MPVFSLCVFLSYQDIIIIAVAATADDDDEMVKMKTDSVQCNDYDIFKLKQTANTFGYSAGISLKWNIFVFEML